MFNFLFNVNLSLTFIILIYSKLSSDVEKTNESAIEKLRNRVMETNTSFSNTLSLFEIKNREYLDTQEKLSGNILFIVKIFIYVYIIRHIIVYSFLNYLF